MPPRRITTTRTGASSTCRTTGRWKAPSTKRPTSPRATAPRGIGWYRRQFRLDPADRGRHLELQFDGVATHCEVWLNGTVVARNWCGYTSFYVDLTPFAQFGDSLNTLAVRVDADAMEGWWYEGAGMYRHTWLVKRDPVHLVTDGVYANPGARRGRRVDRAGGSHLEQLRRGPCGRGSRRQRDRSPRQGGRQRQRPGGRRPARRNAVARLSLAGPFTAPLVGGQPVPCTRCARGSSEAAGCIDEAVTVCGFRTIRFDADKGFFLNDQPLKLKGVCNHQDHAGVGVAVPDALWDFRVRKLKEMGANAYRCAHNPPAAEFLAACDRLGMLVMDENRNFNTSPEYVRQLQWMVRRDRNHPSVILWSVFNEEPFQGTEQGYQMVRRMAAEVKKLDITRPVTAAQSGGNLNPVNASQAADVAGFNYQQGQYDAFHKPPTPPGP